jgi:hypothetical protein
MELVHATKATLGHIGETLPNSEFRIICNLNTIKPNFPVFDILAEKDGDIYAFSVKARKRYGQNGKVNPCYNLLTGGMARKFKKALDALSEMGYPTVRYCFLVAPLEEDTICTWYWGEFTEVNPDCTSENILANNIRYFGIPMTNLSAYKVFGTRSWEEIVASVRSKTDS